MEKFRKINKSPGPNKSVLGGFFSKINKRPGTFIRNSRVRLLYSNHTVENYIERQTRFTIRSVAKISVPQIEARKNYQKIDRLMLSIHFCINPGIPPKFQSFLENPESVFEVHSSIVINE